MFDVYEGDIALRRMKHHLNEMLDESSMRNYKHIFILKHLIVGYQAMGDGSEKVSV
jgi:hypothetical protein